MRFIKKYPGMAGVAVGILVLIAVSYIYKPEREMLVEDQAEAVASAAVEQEAELVIENNSEDRTQADIEYISAVFPVLSAWEPEQLKGYLTEATLSASSIDEIEEVLLVLEKNLGELRHYDRPTPVPNPDIPAALDNTALLSSYHFIAWYSAGSAEVDLVLQEAEDSKRLYAFNIEVTN